MAKDLELEEKIAAVQLEAMLKDLWREFEEMYLPNYPKGKLAELGQVLSELHDCIGYKHTSPSFLSGFLYGALCYDLRLQKLHKAEKA